MSDTQPSHEVAGVRTLPARRNWRLFAILVLAGIAVATGLWSLQYLPEDYQWLLAMTGLGVAGGFFVYLQTDLDRRETIGVAGAMIFILTYSVATRGYLIAWLVCGAGALTAIVVLALRWSDPLWLDPDSNRGTPQ